MGSEVKVIRVGEIVIFLVSVLAFWTLVEPNPPLSYPPLGISRKYKIVRRKTDEKKIKTTNNGSVWLLLSTKKSDDSKSETDLTHEENVENTVIKPIISSLKLKEDELTTQLKGIKIVLTPKKKHIVLQYCMDAINKTIASMDKKIDSAATSLTTAPIDALLTAPAKDVVKHLEYEIEKYKRQAKREAELRVAAEENLKYCEIQLQKERQTVLSLQAKLIKLQDRLNREDGVESDESDQDRVEIITERDSPHLWGLNERNSEQYCA